MLGKPRQRMGNLTEVIFISLKEIDLCKCQVSRGQGPCLIEGDDANIRQGFDGGSSAVKDAAASSTRDGGEDRRGDREDEGAGRVGTI